MDKYNINNRAFTSEELLSLLKELKVSKVNDEECIKNLKNLDGKLGNPDNQQSMRELAMLLLNFDVDVWNENNLKIIGKFINNKKVIINNKKNNKNFNLSFYKENIDIETYIRMVLLDLGLKPYLSGFEFLKDIILYLMRNDGNSLGLVKDVYPVLGEKYGIKYFNIERCLRTSIKSAILNHYDNEVCNFVYNLKDKITVGEYIYLVMNYIKHDLKERNVLFDINETDYCYCGSNKAMELKSNLIGTSDELEDLVSKLINSFGIFPKINGYYYLKYAILYFLNNDSIGNYLSFCDYLASIYDTSGKNVERNIRYAVGKCRTLYSTITKEEFQSNLVPDVIKFVYNYENETITSEFISLVAEYIKLTVNKGILDEYTKENQVSLVKRLKK